MSAPDKGPLTGKPDLLVARNLDVIYGGRRSAFGAGKPAKQVLHGVNMRLARGETLGIVGESGSGKTTLGRALLRLIEPHDGRIMFDGQDITHIGEDEMRPFRRRMQMIFQDPMASLNPRHTIRRILVEPMLLHGVARNAEAAETLVNSFLARVGLPAIVLDRNPHELSGGQRQRIGIARALLLRPDFVLADEVVSGLDVSTQAQVLTLLKDLSVEFGLALAFISHDLSVIRAVCDRVIVLKDGRVVEEGACETVFAAPKAAYTRMLINAIPLPEIDPTWLDREAAVEAVS
jgi:peptide/nickel transport system ATP-binding protein